MFSYDAYLRYVLPFRDMLMGYRAALSSCEFAILRHDCRVRYSSRLGDGENRK